MYSCGFIMDCQRGRLLGSYFYIIAISYDKTYFTCIWVNLSRFKTNITSSYIEDMEITQELFKKSWIYRSRYLLNTCQSIEIYWSSILVLIPLDLSSLRDFWYSLQRFNSIGYLFMGLYDPYRTKKAQGLCKLNRNRRVH